MKSMKDIFRSYGILDEQGRHVNGTDKETNHHYGDAYEELFPNRAEIKMVMEIGVTDGSSMKAWRDIFPNATVVGLDIHHCAGMPSERCEFHLGDQRSKEDCERAAAGRQFDFICEDATHVLPDTLTTLLYLWPFIKAGGLYIVEEFSNVGALHRNIRSLFPFAEIMQAEHDELVVLRKPI